MCWQARGDFVKGYNKIILFLIEYWDIEDSRKKSIFVHKIFLPHDYNWAFLAFGGKKPPKNKIRFDERPSCGYIQNDSLSQHWSLDVHIQPNSHTHIQIIRLWTITIDNRVNIYISSLQYSECSVQLNKCSPIPHNAYHCANNLYSCALL